MADTRIKWVMYVQPSGIEPQPGSQKEGVSGSLSCLLNSEWHPTWGTEETNVAACMV